MTNVEPIISRLPLPKSNNSYLVLCLAVQEAARLYPDYPNKISLEELCRRIMHAAGKTNPKSVLRSLERAVEYIWLHKENNPALLAIYEHSIVDKLSAKDFIASAARYICLQSASAPDSSLQLAPPGTPYRYLSKEGTPYFVIPCSHPAVQTLLHSFLGGDLQ